MERNILDTEIALAKDTRQEKVSTCDGPREVSVVPDPERGWKDSRYERDLQTQNPLGT